MKAFIQHIIAFSESKWVALVHAWPGFLATALLVLGGWEVKVAAVVGALVHTAMTYLHFSSTPATPPVAAAPAQVAASDTATPVAASPATMFFTPAVTTATVGPPTIQVLGTIATNPPPASLANTPIKVIDIPPATDAAKTV